MTDYKLMPKQITKEMADAFWEEYSKDRADDLLMRCYRALYITALSPQSAEQPTFTVGTDLSNGKLTVVVMKHENDNSWVIHTEVIQLAEQQREPCHECGGNGAGGEHEEDCSQQTATEVERHLVETLLQQYETNRHLTIGRWIEHGPFAKLFATYPKQRGKP